MAKITKKDNQEFKRSLKNFKNEADIEKDEFISNCIIYSLFNINASYQTS